MRIGVNISNDIYERFKPLRASYNLSQICRNAVVKHIESYEKALHQAKSDGMQSLTDKLFQEYSKQTVLDWEEIGRENAKKWAEDASLQDFEDLFHNISIHKRRGFEPEEFLGAWRAPQENSFNHAEEVHKDWFHRQRDLDLTTNHILIAKAEYNRGWISYLTVVWQMLRERIEADIIALEKSKQQSELKPEIPEKLADSSKE
jgi:hypothetical protein